MLPRSISLCRVEAGSSGEDLEITIAIQLVLDDELWYTILINGSKCKMELPDDRGYRVHLTILPDPKADKLKLEHKNSSTYLLMTTVAYNFTKMFMDSGTQKEMVTKYKV